MARHQMFGPEHLLLDPQLQGQSSIQATVKADGNSPVTSTMAGLAEVPDTVGDSRHVDDAEEDIGAWSL